jgi:hypothetical protein
MKRVLMVVFLCCTCILSYADELTITGIYIGSNLFIQNPLSADKKGFCVTQVTVNNNPVTVNLTKSAFEVDLSALQINQPVLIKVFHKPGCEPAVINPEALNRHKSNFTFQQVYIKENTLSWSTVGESPQGKFEIEKQINGQWTSFPGLQGKGTPYINQYEYTVTHEEGINVYRIAYVNRNGMYFYSEEISFETPLEPISIFFTSLPRIIKLSREAEYEIVDNSGNKIKTGKDKVIELAGIKPGIYYLNVEERSERFIKKK